MDLSTRFIAINKIFPSHCKMLKHLEKINNKARILKTTKVDKLIVTIIYGIFK